MPRGRPAAQKLLAQKSSPKKRGRPSKNHLEDPQILVDDTHEPRPEHFKNPEASFDFTDWPHKYLEANDPKYPTPEAFWGSLDLKMVEIALEPCPETGRPHLQGRFMPPRKMRFAQLKKILPPWVRFAPTKCCLDLLYFQKFGTTTFMSKDLRRQGKRPVFKEQLEAVQKGATLKDCVQMEGANGQSFRSGQLLLEYFEPERPQAERFVHLVASSSTPMPTGVYRLNDMRFWNGYDADSNIYIDQTVCKLTLPQLKMICGPAPFRVGRGRQARFDHVYISGLTADEREALEKLSLLPAPARGLALAESLLIRRS